MDDEQYTDSVELVLEYLCISKLILVALSGLFFLSQNLSIQASIRAMLFCLPAWNLIIYLLVVCLSAWQGVAFMFVGFLFFLEKCTKKSVVHCSDGDAQSLFYSCFGIVKFCVVFALRIDQGRVAVIVDSMDSRFSGSYGLCAFSLWWLSRIIVFVCLLTTSTAMVVVVVCPSCSVCWRTSDGDENVVFNSTWPNANTTLAPRSLNGLAILETNRATTCERLTFTAPQSIGNFFVCFNDGQRANERRDEQTNKQAESYCLPACLDHVCLFELFAWWTNKQTDTETARSEEKGNEEEE